MADKSPFPTDFLGVDLFYDGGWQPVGGDLDQSGVRISHGARSEGSRSDVSSLSFTVTNADGTYSPRNPVSPLYGLVGRNTPARARVDLGAPWVGLESDGARATTPDVSGLTGDIDLRWWGSSHTWNYAADIISKYDTTGDQRGFILRAEVDGTLRLYWSEDGVTLLNMVSEGYVPAWEHEIALRVHFDVNNGSGGRTARFYYATGLDGPWVQVGGDVVESGTTSIFNSTAPLTIGKNPASSAVDVPQRVYGWEISSGGAVVSSATAASLTVGATAFADDQANTWTITNGNVTNTHVLAVCEVAEWPMDWNTKGAPSVLTDVQASGVTRRLGQGAQALDSVLYRTISGIEDLVGYWPMEDGSDADVLGAAVGSDPAVMLGGASPAAYDSFPGSAPIPTLGDGRITADVDSATDTGAVQVRWVQWTPTGALPISEVIMCRLRFQGGTIGRVDFRLRDSDGALGVFGYDQDGVQLSGSSYFIPSADIRGTSQRISLEVEQDGPGVTWRWVKLEPGADSANFAEQSFTGSNTLGRLRSVVLNPNRRSLTGWAVGHLTAENQITSIFDVYGSALVGYTDEPVGSRIVRLAAESGVGVTVHGRRAMLVGEQQEETLLDLLAEAADADGGILYDDPRRIGLRYRMLVAMEDQPAVVIPYQDNLVVPFRPTDDDGMTRNRVSVTRPNGTRFTHEKATGPMSIADVGLYDTALQRNIFSDEYTDRTAAWLLHLGTWDEGRYPTLGVDLAHPYFLGNPELTRRLLDIMPGDRIVITDPPPWLPPRSVDVLVRGVTATISPHSLRLQWTCVPARPYHVAYWNAGHRWSGVGTVLASGVSDTATALTVTTPSGVAWTHADGDYDIRVGGEQMTVTGVSGNTLTVTRSVNGVAKAHNAADAVELAEPSFYAR